MPATDVIPIVHERSDESDARRQLIERIVRTDPFQKSSRLTSLLFYLAEHSLREVPGILTEQRIGVEVFGKPADYTPAEDSSVRVHVRQLRLRLHEYFGSKGKDETLVVDIPKGAYTLEFHAVERTAGAPADSPAPPPNTKPVRKWKTIQAAFPWIALLLALVCALGWYRAAREVRKPLPWPLNAVIQADKPTNIVIADSNLMLLLLRNSEVTLDQYLDPEYRRSAIPKQMDENETRLVRYISNSQLTSVADVVVTSTLVRLAGAHSDHLVIRWARDLNRRDLVKGNFIFLGSKASDPWVALFEDKLNFKLTKDPATELMFFRNQKPLPGEQNEYFSLKQTGTSGDDFATLCLVPGKFGSGDVLIIQGLAQEGTEAIGVLLSDAAARRKLQEVLMAANGGSQPAYFEALIHTRTVAGAPVSVDIVGVRVIKP